MTRLEDFDLGDVIGVGTVGTIYSAVRQEDGQRVAIKKLHAKVCDDPLIRSRFRREVTVMQRLNHPNIVRFYGSGEDDGSLFYAMELVDGGTVKDLLEHEVAFAWPVAADIARQICSALQCAHNNGVVHRDLKPGNLFLTGDGEVKLGDFGIARDLKGTDITADGMTVGTHAYMSPEQIKGETSVSGKTDLYALGCCLFEMLVGRKVFVAQTHPELFDLHLRNTPPRVRHFVKECPAELDEIVFRLLAKDPDQRPFNARQVQGVLLELEAQPNRVSLDQGREMLKLLIRRRMVLSQPTEIGWKAIAAMLAGIIVVVAAAILLSR